MKIEKKTPYIFGGEIHLSVPTHWAQLTQRQLRYVYFLRSSGFDDTQIQTLCLVRFAGIEVLGEETTGWHCTAAGNHFYLLTWEVRHFIALLDFLKTPPPYPVRLEYIDGYRAVDECLHDLPFEDYLAAENYYQAYIRTKEDARLVGLANLLYRDRNGKPARMEALSTLEQCAVLGWYCGLKQLFAGRFPHFFTLTDADDEEEREVFREMENAMNMQIRALTGGDITKEATILQTDVWRALTELNEKAREAKEWERRTKR